jgi:hypothetical protein
VRKRHERLVRWLALLQAGLYARIWYRRQAALPWEHTHVSSTPPPPPHGRIEARKEAMGALLAAFFKEEPWRDGEGVGQKFTCEVDQKAGAATNQIRVRR